MLDAARRIAKEAGERLLARFGRLTAGEIERFGRRDVVTSADREAESYIASALREVDPRIPILAEEAWRAGSRPNSRGLCWVVDPLDGTVNFVQGIPLFAVSVGLVEGNEPVLGVVHLPALAQTFYGAPGGGCFENERPVAVSPVPLLEEAILATGFAYRREEMANDNLEHAVGILRQVRGIRRLGAAAIDLAYVASGRLDGYWELGLSPWDVAAGAALVRAAGGEVSDAQGGETWLHGKSIVATNGLLHDSLLAALGGTTPSPPLRATPPA